MLVLSEFKTLLLFAVTSIALLVVPGPAVLYVIARSLEQGWRAGIVSALGLSGGAVIHIVLATLGVAALVQSSSAAFTVIRIAGAVFLVYLGVRTIKGSRSGAVNDASGVDSLRRVYAQGMLVNLSNPKAMLFFFAFLPQFADPNKGAVAGQLLILGAVFLLLAFVNDASWALLAGWIGGWINRNPSLAVAQRYAAGVLLILLGTISAVSIL